MNLLDEVNSRIYSIPKREIQTKLNSAISHITIAHERLGQARKSGDISLYNDVIYRCNQSYEGILKETYSILTEKNGYRLTPNQIENNFQNELFFSKRVQSEFENYRKNWRNTSSHDHTIKFTENEAIMAIINVSSFAIVLISELVKKIKKDEKLGTIDSIREDILNEFENIQTESLQSICRVVLDQFSKTLLSYEACDKMDDFEVSSRLKSFIESLNIQLSAEYVNGPFQSKYLPLDLIISRDKEKLGINIKSKLNDLGWMDRVDGIRKFLEISGIFKAIIFYWSKSDNDILALTTLYKEYKGNGSKNTYVIFGLAPNTPKNK